MAQGEQENKAENKQPEEEVLQHLQILLNPKQNPNITDEILSKKWIREWPIRVKSVLSAFIFDLYPCRRLGTPHLTTE